MRNPDRIEPFMNKLAKIWRDSAPDMRFGQFITNVLGEMSAKHGDPFFWEEDKFMEYIKEIPWIEVEEEEVYEIYNGRFTNMCRMF